MCQQGFTAVNWGIRTTPALGSSARRHRNDCDLASYHTRSTMDVHSDTTSFCLTCMPRTTEKNVVRGILVAIRRLNRARTTLWTSRREVSCELNFLDFLSVYVSRPGSYNWYIYPHQTVGTLVIEWVLTNRPHLKYRPCTSTSASRPIHFLYKYIVWKYIKQAWRATAYFGVPDKWDVWL